MSGVSTKVPKKPGILMLLDALESSGLPIFAGGLFDQPEETMNQLQIAKHTRSMMCKAVQSDTNDADESIKQAIAAYKKAK